MKKLKIAILDNGVDETVLKLCGLPSVIQYNQADTDDNRDLFLHGTNCTIVIGLNCDNVQLYSYKILDNTGKGSVTALKSALEWCLSNHLRLVNLSFGTTHFKDKREIRQVVNQYANRGLIIVAATANSGYTAFPVSVSSVIGVRAGDTFGIDDESLRERGVDFIAPSEHKFQLAGEKITLQKSNSYAAPYVTAIIGRLLAEQPEASVWQIKKRLYQKFGKECVQYASDWIEKGWIAGKALGSRAEVYFEMVERLEDADTVILYDLNELEKYQDKHIVYLGEKTTEEPDIQNFFWSRKNKEKQIVCSRLKKENINIPVISIKFDNGQDEIWWLTELRRYFESDGYNAYTVSTEPESILYDLEYLPLDVDESIVNKIYDFVYWQTYYNQSDLIIYGTKDNKQENFDEQTDILIEIGNKGKKTDIQVCCDRIKRIQVCFESIGEQEIRKVYDYLIVFLMEDEDEQ